MNEKKKCTLDDVDLVVSFLFLFYILFYFVQRYITREVYFTLFQRACD